MPYMRIYTKIVKTLVEVFYPFFEQANDSGRHDGGLVSLEFTDCSPVIEKVVWYSEEPILENFNIKISVVLCSLEVNRGINIHVSISVNMCKLGWHYYGVMALHKQLSRPLCCNAFWLIWQIFLTNNHTIYEACDKNDDGWPCVLSIRWISTLIWAGQLRISISGMEI